MRTDKTKLTGKMKGRLFAPSVIIGKPKQKIKKPAKQVKPPEPSAKDKKVMLKIAKNSKIAAKKKLGALKNPAKSDPKRDAQIERAYNEYMHKLHVPAWGNTTLDPDDKGFDGHADLKLEKFICNELGRPIKRVISNLLAGDQKTVNLVLKAATFNAWEWSNFANRIWVNTLNEQPPIRRVVGINLSDLIPCVNHEGVFDAIISAIPKDKDLVNAFATLGFCKTKVRLLPIMQATAKNSTMYKFYDLLQWQKGNSYNIRGVVAKADLHPIEDLPRDMCIVWLSDQRKSCMQQLDAALGTGHKVIIPFSVLKGDLKSTKEIKASKTYQKLTKTWAGLTPLISMPKNSKMEIISKVSKLGDILLA